jgi:multiple sugar transport system substrate-binding protein
MTAWRRLRTAVPLAALLAAASSCSGPAAPKPTPPPSGALNWYVGATDQNQQDYARIVADEFEIANPGIKVKITYAPTNTDSARAAVIDALGPGAASPPDVYLGDVIWPAEFVSHGRALPLDDQFEPEFWQRFEPALVSAVSYRNRIYAAPFFVDQGLLFYRTDLVPTPPKTWEDLVGDSRDLVQRKKVQYGYVWPGSEYEGLTCIWTEILADAGGGSVTPDGSRAALDSPQALKALEFLRSLISQGTSPAGVTGFEESEANQLFASGHAAFLRGWNSAYSRLVFPNGPDNVLRGKIGVAALPNFAGQRGPGHSTTGGWSLYINPATRQPGTAKTFIRWMTAFQAQLKLAKFSQIPSNIDARRDRVTRANPALATGLEVVPAARPAASPEYPALSKIIYTRLHAALTGTSSAAAALDEANQEINQVLH